MWNFPRINLDSLFALSLDWAQIELGVQMHCKFILGHLGLDSDWAQTGLIVLRLNLESTQTRGGVLSANQSLKSMVLVLEVQVQVQQMDSIQIENN